jgi:hypothetical protein
MKIDILPGEIFWTVSGHASFDKETQALKGGCQVSSMFLR